MRSLKSQPKVRKKFVAWISINAAEMVRSFKMRSLQKICLERICDLLKRGTWNTRARNPFSSMPVKTVDTLMAFLLSTANFIRTRDLRLIFQSGRLSRLDLSTLLIDEEKRLLLSWMSTDACRNLRTLSAFHTLFDESGASVFQKILQRCHNLEEFHSKSAIDMNALRNCGQLKNLRLHLEVQHNPASEDFYHNVVDFFQSKRNLEVFSFCNMNDGFSAYKVLAAILESCPKLITLGFADSSEALFHIRKTRGMVKFKLQRCLWGIMEGDAPPHMGLSKMASYSEKFPDIIQNAVHMCPDVETLVINVFHEQSLEHLIHLKKLRSLSLKFKYNVADNVTALVFLLRRIGPFLEHLSLDIDDAVPAEVIRDHCFNLKSLQIYGSLVLSDDMEDCLNQLLLEQLYIWKADSKSLYLLLRNSPNLVDLFLGEASCLDDELIGRILRYNFIFPRLAVVGIKDCPLLSRDVMHLLLTRACNLKEIFFGSQEVYKRAHELIVVSQHFRKILHYFDSYKLQRREFYIYRPDRCSF